MAFSMLNSNLVFFERNLLRVVEEVRGGGAGAAVDELLDRGAIDQEVDGLAHRRVAEQRMLGLDAGALAVHLGPLDRSS